MTIAVNRNLSNCEKARKKGISGLQRDKLNCDSLRWSHTLFTNILVSPYFRSILRDKTFDHGKEDSGDYSLRIIGKFSSEVQNET